MYSLSAPKNKLFQNVILEWQTVTKHTAKQQECCCWFPSFHSLITWVVIILEFDFLDFYGTQEVIRELIQRSNSVGIAIVLTSSTSLLHGYLASCVKGQLWNAQLCNLGSDFYSKSRVRKSCWKPCQRFSPHTSSVGPLAQELHLSSGPFLWCIPGQFFRYAVSGCTSRTFVFFSPDVGPALSLRNFLMNTGLIFKHFFIYLLKLWSTGSAAHTEAYSSWSVWPTQTSGASSLSLHVLRFKLRSCCLQLQINRAHPVVISTGHIWSLQWCKNHLRVDLVRNNMTAA